MTFFVIVVFHLKEKLHSFLREFYWMLFPDQEIQKYFLVKESTQL